MRWSIRQGVGALMALGFCGIGATLEGQGVSPRFVPPGTAYRLGLTDTRPVRVGFGGGGTVGLQIVGVEPWSPAARAGLEPGDVITRANGLATTQPEDLRRAIAESGGALRLDLVDVRTWKPTVAAVTLGPVGPPNPGPVPPPYPGPYPPPSPGPFPPPPNPGRVQVVGDLRGPVGWQPRPGAFAVVDSSGWSWALDFSTRPDLARAASRLVGRRVLASGIQRPPGGIGIPERQVLQVDDLRPFGGWGGPAPR